MGTLGFVPPLLPRFSMLFHLVSQERGTDSLLEEKAVLDCEGPFSLSGSPARLILSLLMREEQ